MRDEPPNPDWDGVNPHIQPAAHLHANQPEVHDVIRRMRRLLDEYDDRMMVGEIYLPNEELMTYYGGPTCDECHLPFNFQLINAPLACGRRAPAWWTHYEADPAGGRLAQLGAGQP